jgi:hypothetical protein
MSTGIDPYALLAKYYDGAYAAMKDLIDVPFYIDLAKRIGGTGAPGLGIPTRAYTTGYPILPF